MKRETYDILVSQFDSDPAKWYEVLKALLLEMVNESEQRSERRKNAPKKQGPTKKTKSETSTTTTQKVEVKEKSEFDKTIDSFIEMRKAIKKPLTKDWLKLIKDKLVDDKINDLLSKYNELNDKYNKHQDEIDYIKKRLEELFSLIQQIQNSISNSRQWVFPLKEEEKQKTKYNPFQDLSDLQPR